MYNYLFWIFSVIRINSMKKKSYIVFLLFTVLSGYAQDDVLDSLEKELITTKEDTSKVNILNSLSIEYAFSSPEKAVKYYEQAFILSKKIIS